MTEADYLEAAIEERNVVAEELYRLSAHLQKLDEVVAIHRHRVWKQKVVVKFWMEEDEQESGEAGSKTLVTTV